jgi:hypothetical protein
MSTTTNVLPITEACQILEAHGFQVYGWGGTYRVTRDLPPYGMSCPQGKGFHRDWRGFNASEVSLGWVRKLAAALALADAGHVTSSDCANAWDADRKAAIRWEEVGYAHRAACSWKRPDHTLTEQLDLGVAELRAAGAARMAHLTYQVLLETWQIWHPISETIAAIDRGRQPLTAGV